MLRVLGVGLKVLGLGFWVCGFRVKGFRVLGFRCRACRPGPNASLLRRDTMPQRTVEALSKSLYVVVLET